MTRVTAVLALISHSVQQKLIAERAEDDLVELALDEFVAVHLVHLVLLLAHGALTAKTRIDGPLAHVLLDWNLGA